MCKTRLCANYLRAVMLFDWLGFPQIVLETDNEEFLKLWNSVNNKSIGASVIREMKSHLVNLQGFKVQSVRRSANAAAHACARAALSLGVCSVLRLGGREWNTIPPEWNGSIIVFG